MAVAHRASIASGSVNPTTSLTITIPASIAADDVLICAFTSRDHAAGTAVPTCTDNDTGGNVWTVMYSTTDRKGWVFWKRATSATASKTITVAGAVGSVSGGVSGYSGCVTTGIPYDDVLFESNASANETHASIIPSQVDSEVCFAVFNYANDNSVSSVAGANIGALTSRWEKLSTGGSDCGTTMWSLPVGAVAATGNITWSQTNGTTYSLLFTLIPAVDSFPSSTILDDFNRANETPIAGGWSSTAIYASQVSARLVSNQMAHAGTDSQPYWNTPFNADQEAWATVANRSNVGHLSLVARGTDFTTTPGVQDYYDAQFRSDGNLRLTRVVNDVGTTLLQIPQTIATGDAIGLKCFGSRISIWRKPSGGSWGKIATIIDTVIVGGGKIGIVATGGVAGNVFLDDFGGGNYIPPGSGTILRDFFFARG